MLSPPCCCSTPLIQSELPSTHYHSTSKLSPGQSPSFLPAEQNSLLLSCFPFLLFFSLSISPPSTLIPFFPPSSLHHPLIPYTIAYYYYSSLIHTHSVSPFIPLSSSLAHSLTRSPTLTFRLPLLRPFFKDISSHTHMSFHITIF